MMKNTACSLILITASSVAFATDPFETDPIIAAPVFGESTPRTEAEELADFEIFDLNLIAESNGWTLSQTKKHWRSIKRVGFYAHKLARTHPDVFVGAVAPDDWNGNPVIYIKGAVDQVLLSELNARGIDVIDSQPYSLIELKQKQHRVHSNLSDQGYKIIATSFDIREGVVKAKVTRADVTIAKPLLIDDVVITFEDEPVAIYHGVLGGLSARKDFSPVCTVGWSVISHNSLGFSTAGHCSGVNGVKHLTTHPSLMMTEHRGIFGDMEWHTATTDWATTVPTPYFYASENETRSVETVEPVGSIVVGEPLCLYGRGSNQRDCSRRVQTTSMTCSFGEAGVTGKLVQMDGEAGTFGDSGGGWSWGHRAYGSHVGLCGGGSVFTPVALFGRGMGVRVLTREIAEESPIYPYK